MPGICRRSSVGKSISPIMKMSQVRILPSAPDAGSHPDNVRPFVMAHMEMKMVAENCTVGGNRLSVMVLRM